MLGGTKIKVSGSARKNFLSTCAIQGLRFVSLYNQSRTLTVSRGGSLRGAGVREMNPSRSVNPNERGYCYADERLFREYVALPYCISTPTELLKLLLVY